MIAASSDKVPTRFQGLNTLLSELTETTTMSKKFMISIVDDDEPAREAVSGLVRSLGFVTTVFGSAADFLKAAQLSRTACLIADIQMPRMTGLELYEYLVASGTPIPTILITSCANETAQARALKLGIQCYLTKPLNPDDLLVCIHASISDGPSRFD